jgi:TrmH family RNA methyltransferase
MTLRIVQSKQNARLKELRRALTQPMRSGAAGLVGVEGPHLLEEAVRARLRIECVFVAQGAERVLEGMRLAAETDVLLLPQELLASALTTEAPQGVAALVEAPKWGWDHILGRREAALVVALAGVQDPGNLGTMVRSAEAFGASGVVCLPGTVSAWNPKAVRASSGSVFRLPLLAAGEDECLLRLREAGVTVWTTAVHGAEAAHAIDLAGPVALLIGNEGNGVAEELASKADGAVTIPCPGPVESLNAAAAASVLLYEASRQRAAARRP